MPYRAEELRKDIAELESLEKQCGRQKTKDILSIEIRKLVQELQRLEDNNRAGPTPSASNSVRTSNKRYKVKLNNYAWDQSDKFVKFYVTLKNVQTIPPDSIRCEFKPKCVELTVTGLDNKDYVFTINNLLKPIKPEQSNWRVKADMVVLKAAKEEHVNWSHVTEWEKKSADLQKIDKDVDKMDDPTEGLMSLMQKMYEKGDDNMKRTIAKAWTESQDKQKMPF
ncbi:hypothetical protein NQ317_014394 [Molorchus minor]|uniref:Calcyclin-binding protein n=1 Tax=Molorchus minor TaxID=1323400 RepID=A0ABQ9K548_9CUCU|nr:hypothetical protein NQ317_014394 [Molorchus minor]